MLATLTRTSYGSARTKGVLVVGSHEFATLEPPWRNNERNVSCIPEGTYSLAPLRKSSSGKYRRVFWVNPVENRAGILIHNGNLVAHTKGCILIGYEHGKLVGEPAVLASREARDKLWELAPTSLVIKSPTIEEEEPAPTSSWTNWFNRILDSWKRFFNIY